MQYYSETLSLGIACTPPPPPRLDTIGGEEITEQPFEPGFLRPQPPLYHCEEETTWLNPTQGQCPIQWDDQMCSHSAAGGLFIARLTM